jgi:coenzyme PQQ synthesis protein D (PqqD)
MVMMQLRQENLTWQVAGDDVVVLDLQGSVYLKLNGTGRVLWEALVDQRTDSELVSALVDKYGIDEERAAADVTAFLGDLRNRGLLEG